MNFQSFDVEDLKGWEEEFLKDLFEDEWLGNPVSSVELQLLDVSRRPMAESMTRLKDMTDDLQVMACFKDSYPEIRFDYMATDESYSNKVRIIEEQFERGFWDVPTYLESVYRSLPQNVETEFFFQDADISGLESNLWEAQCIVDELEESPHFVSTGADITGWTDLRHMEDAFREFEDSLSLNLYLSYSGNSEAVEEYNTYTSEIGDFNEYAGVPVTVSLGHDSRPVVYVFNKVNSLSYREIEGYIAQSLGGTVAASGEINTVPEEQNL